nr:MAG TPA: hypothetical protein [Caudoviricetes sp.]
MIVAGIVQISYIFIVKARLFQCDKMLVSSNGDKSEGFILFLFKFYQKGAKRFWK